MSFSLSWSRTMYATGQALIIAAVTVAVHSCPVHRLDGFSCEQFDLNCALADLATSAKMHLKHGTCADAGYTERGKSVTKKLPVIGKVRVTKYTKYADACTVHKIEGLACGQMVLDCTLARVVVGFKTGLENGTCTGAGYTVKGKSFTEYIPSVGAVTVTEYKIKPHKHTCSLHSIEGFVCREMGLECTLADVARFLNSEMKKGTCARVGYTEKSKSYTEKVPMFGKVKITEYTRPAVVA